MAFLIVTSVFWSLNLNWLRALAVTQDIVLRFSTTIGRISDLLTPNCRGSPGWLYFCDWSSRPWVKRSLSWWQAVKSTLQPLCTDMGFQIPTWGSSKCGFSRYRYQGSLIRMLVHIEVAKYTRVGTSSTPYIRQDGYWNISLFLLRAEKKRNRSLMMDVDKQGE